MKKELDKAYQPKDYEDKIYQLWQESGYFNPDNLAIPADAPSYTIILPPPNITAKLHLGHASTVAIEDLLIRFARMQGQRALWLPGTDHAAIATQSVVEKKIWQAEHKTRQELGREAFLTRVDEFVAETQAAILNQLKKLGASLDWSRLAFTLDEPRARAVRTMFKLMYDEGAIYRGERVVNWCPHCQSTLADDEVEYREQTAKLYTFKYDDKFPLEISTTRPETKLGDAAVAINPKDERYKKLIGQTLSADFCGVKLNLKIIADRGVDVEFGTGALGVTPAHSLSDWQLAQTESLPLIKVINEQGKINDGFGKFSGLAVLEARELIVAELVKRGLLIKEEEIKNNLSVCYRCQTAIEPLPSKQWFVAVDKPLARLKNKSLKAKALAVAEKQQIKFTPERFGKTYVDWINNLRDWCVSRQIWYGHRIPVWYCRACNETTVSDSAPTTFIVMRHGQAQGNVEGWLNSDPNFHNNNLTALGQQQAVEAAAKLQALKLPLRQGFAGQALIIYSSDIDRAKETAEIIAREFDNVKIKFDQRLREIGMGDFERKSVAEYDTVRDGDFESWQTGNPHNIESAAQVKARAEEFLREKVSQHPGETILVVTHGDIIKYAQAWQKNLDARAIFALGYPDNGQFITVKNAVVACAKCGSADIWQDSDTLDTWFSSGMWTFSTLGWPHFSDQLADSRGKPHKINDLERFHPTQVLETGYDIISLWVSRMIIMSLFALDEIPFSQVYLHGMILDNAGKKMSKTKGNGVDPLDLIARYGTDAMRLSLLIGTTAGNDAKFNEEKVESMRNLVNKLWNVSRFIEQRLKIKDKKSKAQIKNQKFENLTLAEGWILDKFNALVVGVTENLERFEFGAAGEALLKFTWDDLADWYLEASKFEESENQSGILDYILENLLKLWQPFIPFVTEAIWQEMGHKDLLMVTPWPTRTRHALSLPVGDRHACPEQFELVKEIIVAIRNARAANKIEPSKKLSAIILTDKKTAWLEAQKKLLIGLRTGLSEVEFKPPLRQGYAGQAQVINLSVNGVEIYLLGAVDEAAEKARQGKRITELEELINRQTVKLENKEFVENAPKNIVQAEQDKLQTWQEELTKLSK